jgi:hypothetical protein
LRPLVALTAVAAATLTALAAPPSAGAQHRASSPPHRRAHPASSPKEYARELAAKRGWVGAEWAAIVEIVEGPVRADGKRSGGESGWDPCAVYPSRHDCGYAGENSCGIPQANPCPPAWQGRLGRTWRSQVRWMLDYFVTHGYGRPSVALAHHRRTGSY